MNLEDEIAQRVDKALDGDCGYGVGEYLAAALMPLVKRAQAEALREAAKSLNENFQEIPAWIDAYRNGQRTDEWVQGGVRMVMSAIDVLGARANRIESEAPNA